MDRPSHLDEPAPAGSGAADSLSHRPDGPWTFDAAVASCFPDMLRRSIPLYAVMRHAVNEFARGFRRDGTAVVDLGCSHGDAMAPLVREFAGRNHFIGVERSPAMLDHARARFLTYPDVKLLDLDLEQEYPDAEASVTLAVLTLQFMSYEARRRVIQRAYANTVRGGALIVVEKVRAQSGIEGVSDQLDQLFTELYHAHKRDQGYSDEAIATKAEALRGVLRPLPAQANEHLLAAAGFSQVECFWRWVNFAAWIAVR